MPVDLAEIPTSELVEELENRCVASLCCLILPESAAGKSSTTKAFYRGNNFTLLGLAESAAHRMRCKIHDKLQPGADED